LSHADSSQYVHAPVLAKLAVDDFVSAFLALHPNAQRMAMAAFESRYADGRLDQGLKEERPWIKSVHEELARRLPKLSAISQYHLEQQLGWYLKLADDSHELPRILRDQSELAELAQWVPTFAPWRGFLPFSTAP
jgi:hypothetical protein